MHVSVIIPFLFPSVCDTTIDATGVDINANETDLRQDPPEIRELFKFLQILTAVLAVMAFFGHFYKFPFISIHLTVFSLF